MRYCSVKVTPAARPTADRAATIAAPPLCRRRKQLILPTRLHVAQRPPPAFPPRLIFPPDVHRYSAAVAKADAPPRLCCFFSRSAFSQIKRHAFRLPRRLLPSLLSLDASGAARRKLCSPLQRFDFRRAPRARRFRRHAMPLPPCYRNKKAACLPSRHRCAFFSLTLSAAC